MVIDGPECSAEARVRWPQPPENKNRRAALVHKSRETGAPFSCFKNIQEQCQSEKSMCHKMTSHLCTPQVSPRYPPDRSQDIPPTLLDCHNVVGKPRTGGLSPADAKAGQERHTGGLSPAGANAQICSDRCYVGPQRKHADPLQPLVPSAPYTGPRTVDSRSILGRLAPAIVTLVRSHLASPSPLPPLPGQGDTAVRGPTVCPADTVNHYCTVFSDRHARKLFQWPMLMIHLWPVLCLHGPMIAPPPP